MATFGFELRLERHDTTRLVPEGHAATLLVLDEMRGEHVGLRPPWPEQHREPTKAWLASLCPELVNCLETGIAASLHDEVTVARTTRDRERTADAARTNGRLDLVEPGVHGPSRIALVWPDVVDRHLDRTLDAGIRVIGKIPGATGRIAHIECCRDETPPFLDGHVSWRRRDLVDRFVRHIAIGAAHAVPSSSRSSSTRIPCRLGISSQASMCMTVYADGVTPLRRRSCRCTGMRAVAASL